MERTLSRRTSNKKQVCGPAWLKSPGVRLQTLPRASASAVPQAGVPGGAGSAVGPATASSGWVLGWWPGALLTCGSSRWMDSKSSTHGAVGPSGQPRALVSAVFPQGLPALAGAPCGERGHGQL